MREVVEHNRTTKTLFDRVSDFVDACVWFVAPATGAARMAARHQSRAMLSAFEGGARADELRDGSWLGSKLSITSAQEEDLASLRDKSRELYRNDSYGGSIEDKVNHVVGTGFTPQCKIREEIVGLEASRIYRGEIESIYNVWQSGCDINNKSSLWQLTRLIARHYYCDGEGLAVMSDSIASSKPIPLTIEVIDPERLETPAQHAGKKLIRLGVEKNSDGKIVAYWIRKTHPGDTLDIDLNYDRVPADRVLHVFEKWFAGQLRGLPWLTRAINRTKDSKDLDEAEIISSQVQACYAVFVKQKSGNPYETAEATASKKAGVVRYQDIKGGAIHYMEGSDEISFAQPTRTGGTYAEAQGWNYRRIAAALNYPYEMLVKDWRGVSFAGGRLILNGLKLAVKSEQKIIVEQFLAPIWNRVVEECVLFLKVSVEARNYADRPWIYQEHRWSPPAWSYAITPLEEVKAKSDAVEANQMTLEDVCGEGERDLEEVLKQRKKEVELMREYGILPNPTKEADAKVMTAENVGANSNAN